MNTDNRFIFNQRSSAATSVLGVFQHGVREQVYPLAPTALVLGTPRRGNPLACSLSGAKAKVKHYFTRHLLATQSCRGEIPEPGGIEGRIRQAPVGSPVSSHQFRALHPASRPHRNFD